VVNSNTSPVRREARRGRREEEEEGGVGGDIGLESGHHLHDNK